MIGSDADEVLPGITADEKVVLLKRDEDDVDVEGGEVDLVDVEGCDILGECGALRGGEGVGVGEDSPERHDCCEGCLLLEKNRVLLVLRWVVS